MYRKQFYPILTVILVICIASLSLGVGTAQAQAPGNDDFNSPMQVDALPFHDEQNTTEATLADGEPVGCGDLVYDKTIWYTITPQYDMVLNILKSGSDYRADVYVYTGLPGAFTQVAGWCSQDYNDVRFRAYPNTTYYIMVIAGSYPYWEGPPNGGNLVLNIQEIPLPTNDYFANATVVDSIPFLNTVESEFATWETGEPSPSCGISGHKTVWYAFTPDSSRTYTINNTYGGERALAVYTGSTLESLAEVACVRGWYGSGVSVPLQAGTTYYFQLAVIDTLGWTWIVIFDLNLTPPPNLDYYSYPGDPNKFDTIQFQNYSGDPGGMGLTALWDFGDGSTSTDWNPIHRYAVDGDYTLRLTATATDGRSNWAEKVIQVRTHDVAITRFTAPTSASVGQTRQVTVYINNKYYDETVEVILYKSTPGGYVQVGVLRLYVPVRPTNRTVPFAFSYTFSPEDAAMGKVTFKAVANLVSARDGLLADNEAISFPTKVAR